MNNTITQNQFFQLVGLLALAANHRKALAAINVAAVEILGTDYLVDDAVWCGPDTDAKDLLEKLAITVEPAKEYLAVREGIDKNKERYAIRISISDDKGTPDKERSEALAQQVQDAIEAQKQSTDTAPQDPQ